MKSSTTLLQQTITSLLMSKNKKRIEVEGNNGADFLIIEDLGDGTVYINSGSCCVSSIRAVVPVEFLTKIIQDVMLESNNDIAKIIDNFGWDEQFKEELKSKVREI